MRRCSICGTDYYSQSYYEPAEPCWCGEMAHGSLWEWDRWRAYRKWVRYHLAQLCF